MGLNPLVGNVAADITPDIGFRQYLSSQLPMQDILIENIPAASAPGPVVGDGRWWLWGEPLITAQGGFSLRNPIPMSLSGIAIGEMSDIDILALEHASPIPQSIITPEASETQPVVLGRYRTFVSRERPWSSTIMGPISLGATIPFIPTGEDRFRPGRMHSNLYTDKFDPLGEFGETLDEFASRILRPAVHIRLGYRADAVPALLGAYKRAPKTFIVDTFTSNFGNLGDPARIVVGVPIYGRGKISATVTASDCDYRVSYVSTRMELAASAPMEERAIFPAVYPGSMTQGPHAAAGITGTQRIDLELEPRTEDYLVVIAKRVGNSPKIVFRASVEDI